MKIYTLVGRPGTAETDRNRPRRPADALLRRYMKQLLDSEPPPATAATAEID